MDPLMALVQGVVARLNRLPQALPEPIDYGALLETQRRVKDPVGYHNKMSGLPGYQWGKDGIFNKPLTSSVPNAPRVLRPLDATAAPYERVLPSLSMDDLTSIEKLYAPVKLDTLPMDDPEFSPSGRRHPVVGFSNLLPRKAKQKA
jgi:hypothetical protein